MTTFLHSQAFAPSPGSVGCYEATHAQLLSSSVALLTATALFGRCHIILCVQPSFRAGCMGGELFTSRYGARLRFHFFTGRPPFRLLHAGQVRLVFFTIRG